MVVLDLSQYDLPTFDAECFKQNGVTGAILGVYTPHGPGAMGQAAQYLLDAGIALHGFYGLIYFGSPTGAYRDTKWAIELAKKFGVSRVWLDCEIDAKAIGFTDAVTPTRESRVAEIRECVRLVEDAGLHAGIYSGAWWWPGNTGNSTEFSHLPLWHAAYLNDGSKVRTVNYGGWTECAIHQWTSSLNVCGRNRDANHVWDNSVMEGDEMTPHEKARLERIERLLAGRGAVPVTVTGGNLNAIRMVRPEANLDDVIELSGDDTLAYLDYQGSNLWLGLARTQDRVRAIEADMEPPNTAPRVIKITGATLTGELES